MITSVSILLFVCGFYYIVLWLVRNDGAAGIADQKGWLRMRAVRPPARETTGGRRRNGAR